MPLLVRSLLQWLVYGGLLMVAGGLLLLSKADPVTTDQLRLRATDLVTPILDGLGRPVDGLANVLAHVQDWVWLKEENERLRLERDRLLHWQTLAQRLEAENASLKQLLNYVPEGAPRVVSARVVGDPAGAFAQSLLANAGGADGVAKGQIVLSGEGLVGRVVAVAPRTARVLLLTDLNSRVPVVVGPGRIRAILAGDNSERPKLAHIDSDAEIVPGDAVVTSGTTGAFPPGIPVGVVAGVDAKVPSVRPRIDRSRIESVRIADYGAAGDLAPPVRRRGLGDEVGGAENR